MGLSYQKTCSINPNISLLTTGSLKPPKEWQMHCLNVWGTCRPEAIILGAAVAIRCFLESASMDGSKCKAPCSSRLKLAKIYDCFIDDLGNPQLGLPTNPATSSHGFAAG